MNEYYVLFTKKICTNEIKIRFIIFQVRYIFEYINPKNKRVVLFCKFNLKYKIKRFLDASKG